MAETVKTTPDGVDLPLASLAVAVTGSPPTALTVVYQGNTYVQTITYSGSNVSNVSQWTKQ